MGVHPQLRSGELETNVSNLPKKTASPMVDTCYVSYFHSEN